MENVDKNNQEHTKYYNSDGIEVPSCTTVIKLLNKPSLVGWANYMGFRHKNVNDILKEKADYGTYYHNLAEQYFMGIVDKSDPCNDNISMEEYKIMLNRLDVLNEQFKSMGIEIINMEMQMHGSRFGGTLDLLTYCKRLSKVILFDFKTSKSVYDSHLIQLGGYCQLVKEIYDIDITDVGIILLSQSPTSKNFINLVSRENNQVNEEIFTKLLDIYYLKESLNK